MYFIGSIPNICGDPPIYGGLKDLWFKIALPSLQYLILKVKKFELRMYVIPIPNIKSLISLILIVVHH